MQNTTFAFMPAFGEDERETLLLARSIRRYGGKFSGSPIWVLNPEQTPLSNRALKVLEDLNCSVISFRLPEPALDFPYAQKVYAAAEAECRARGDVLLWMDSDSILIDQPDEILLQPGKILGCSPVHIKNISSSASEPVDGFWQAIYESCGGSLDRVFNLTTMMDQLEIRAHFNAGLLAVRPAAGLLSAWKYNFEQLYMSPVFLSFYSRDPRYRIFIHQAILAGTILGRLRSADIQLFSNRYNLPRFLLERFPTRVEDPVLCRYDDYAFIQEGTWRAHACLARLSLIQ